MSAIIKRSASDRYPKPRSSKTRNPSGSSLHSLSSRKTLQKISEEEERELVVYAVREDLLNRTMDEINKRYMEKQCTRFLVHCTYRALCEMVSQYFYVHNQSAPYYMEHPLWCPGKEPHTSPPDSWAAHNVPIGYKKEVEEVEEVEVEAPVKDEDRVRADVSEPFFSEQLVVSEQETTDDELLKTDREMSEMAELMMTEEYEKGSIQEISSIAVAWTDDVVLATDSERAVGIDEPGSVKVGKSHSNTLHGLKSTQSTSVQSMFTKTTKARKESLQHLMEFGMTEIKPSFHPPRLEPMPELPWGGKSTSWTNISSSYAQPCRATIKLSSKKEAPEKKQEKKSKKK